MEVIYGYTAIALYILGAILAVVAAIRIFIKTPRFIILILVAPFWLPVIVTSVFYRLIEKGIRFGFKSYTKTE